MTETPPAGLLLLFQQFAVRPSKTTQFEETWAEMARQRRAHGDGALAIVSSSEDLVYGVMTPVSGWEGVAAHNASDDPVARAAGVDIWAGLRAALAECVISERRRVLRPRLDLSYTPKHPRITFQEIRLDHDVYLYPQWGKVDELEQMVRDLVRVSEEKGITTPFASAEVLVGNDLPLLMVGYNALSTADYYTQSAEDAAQLGDEGAAIIARMYALSRKVKSNNATRRPDIAPYQAPPPSPS